MVLYPFNSAIILNDDIFVAYGGKTGTFNASQRQASYLVAETLVTRYIQTPLLPINVTGTYPFLGRNRNVTDYAYVNQLNEVTVWSKGQLVNCCDLTSNNGCGVIYDDTFGYIDWKQVAPLCGLSWSWGWAGAIVVPNSPYKIQISYNAGLPTGTANHPAFLEALTILAQEDLNEKEPGNSGINETPGALGVQSFTSLDYKEERAKDALVKTDLGDSARAQRAKKLINGVLKRPYRPLLA